MITLGGRGKEFGLSGAGGRLIGHRWLATGQSLRVSGSHIIHREDTTPIGFVVEFGSTAISLIKIDGYKNRFAYV